jgi:DNA invertase Pin-like site-specific DNA recombinase
MKESYSEYRQKCHLLSRKNIESKDNLSIDHIFPCRKGYDMNIPIEVMVDRRNLRLIDLKENIKKSDNIDEIPKFIQEWLLGKVNDIRKKDTRERQLEGIKKAKELKVYTGRKKGAIESKERFLEKHQESVRLLLEGKKYKEISKITGVHVNTITKIKKTLTY